MTARDHRRGAVLTAAIVVALARAAYGDPSPDLTHYVHLQSGSHVSTDGGTKIDLPPGYFYDEPTHSKVETEFKRLQDQETRQTAENKSLRASLDTWQPGWWTLAATVVVGVAAGWYAHDKL